MAINPEGENKTTGDQMDLVTVDHPSGSFRFLPATSAYSAGIAVSEGFEITALRLLDCPSLVNGFRRIDEEIESRGLSPTALVGLHLHSPGVFSLEGFAEFNNTYRQLLLDRSLTLGDLNPISRTNVIPIHDGPKEPSIAMAFIVHPSQGSGGIDFIVAGAGEVDGGLGAENIVARGDLSVQGLTLKVECVLRIMLKRLAALKATGNSPTVVNVYTAQDILGLTNAIVPKLPSISRNGFASWLMRPPVHEVEFEMDCLRYSNWTTI
jgi:hypothetical protein